MKKVTILSVFALSFLFACNKKETIDHNVVKTANAQAQINSQMRVYPYDGPFFQFIPKDSANRMIQSYLTSINSSENDSDVHYYIVNADSLRSYLSDPKIHNVKLMFAHTQSYINGGHEGQPAGYQAGALTIIIAGYDFEGNYIYKNDNQVFNHLKPCPDYCETVGAASSNLLVQ